MQKQQKGCNCNKVKETDPLKSRCDYSRYLAQYDHRKTFSPAPSQIQHNIGGILQGEFLKTHCTLFWPKIKWQHAFR